MAINQPRPALSTRAALALCVSKGHPLTCQSLYNAAIKWGFGGREGTRYKFNEQLLNAYLDRAIEKPHNSEWLTIRAAADRKIVPIHRLYRAIADGLLYAHTFGAGIGVYYVRLSDLERYERFHKDNNNGPI